MTRQHAMMLNLSGTSTLPPVCQQSVDAHEPVNMTVITVSGCDSHAQMERKAARRALEFGVELLDDVHPQAAGPLHAALLQEQDQPAHGRSQLSPQSGAVPPSAFTAAMSAYL